MITPDSFQVLFWSTAQHIFNKCNLIFTTHLFWRWPVLFLSLHRLHRHWFQLGFSVLLQDGCNYPGSIDPHDFDSSSQNITAWNRITTRTLWQWRISTHKSTEEDCSIKMKAVFPRKIQNGAPMCKERNWVLLVVCRACWKRREDLGTKEERTLGKCWKRLFGKDGIKYLLRDQEIWDYFSFTMEIFGSKLLLAYLETHITIIFWN